MCSLHLLARLMLLYVAESFCHTGDGNCAYRAIVFGLVESAFHSHSARLYLCERLQAVHSCMPSWTVIHRSLDNQGCSAEEGYCW